MAKPPFERIFSAIERKKILRRVAREQLKVILKFVNGEVAELKVTGLSGSYDLEGRLLGYRPKDLEKVSALFYVDKDRYLITSKLKERAEGWILLKSSQLFKFNRRMAFRVQVPEKMGLTFFITSARNIEILRAVSVLDFSSGGARIRWFSDKKTPNGTILKGFFQWGRGNGIQIEAMVLHNPQPQTYGVRFINVKSALLNKLKMLSVEIQLTKHQ